MGEVETSLGYHGCMAVVCENGGRKPILLHPRLWSVSAPGFKSERNEVEPIVETITKFTGQRGIFVYARRGNNIAFYKSWNSANLKRPQDDKNLTLFMHFGLDPT